MKIQDDGCPIGLDLSGEIGRLETAETDKAIALKCEENAIQIDLSRRYVDDLTKAMGIIPKGYRWCKSLKRVIYKEEWKVEDANIPDDKHTCQIICDLANSIRDSIQFVGDVASDYEDKCVPILDMAVRMIEIEVQEDKEKGIPAYSFPNIEYRFFKKKMARKTVMMANSAMPEIIRRETLVNEMVRRLANTSQNHPETKNNTVRAVNDYMVAMKRSGYSQKVRRETALASFKTFNRKLREAEENGKPLHRHMDEGASQRFKSNISLKSTWFNKKSKKRELSENDNNNVNTSPNEQRRPRRKPKATIPTTSIKQDDRQVESVIFIPYTHKGELRKRLQKVDDQVTKLMGVGRSKYIEKAGLTLLDQLVEKNVWQSLNGGCQRRHCYVCRSTGGKGISCRAEGTCYQITCKICEKQDTRTVYIGDTSRSTFERMFEHFWLFKSRKEGNPDMNEANSVLWNHSKSQHDSSMKTDDWKVEIVSSHRSPLNRQITEAVRIAREPKESILNSKNKWGANNLAEIILKFGNKVILKPQIRSRGNGNEFKRKRDDEDDDKEEEGNLETESEVGSHITPPEPPPGGWEGGHRDPLEDTDEVPATLQSEDPATKTEGNTRVILPTCQNEPTTGEFLSSTQQRGKGGQTTICTTPAANLEDGPEDPHPHPNLPEIETSPRPAVPKTRYQIKTEYDYKKMKKPDLQKLLKEKRMPVSGTSRQLVERLEKIDREDKGQTTIPFLLKVPPILLPIPCSSTATTPASACTAPRPSSTSIQCNFFITAPSYKDTPDIRNIL